MTLPFVIDFLVSDGGEALQLRDILVAVGSFGSVALVTFLTSKVKSSLE